MSRRLLPGAFLLSPLIIAVALVAPTAARRVGSPPVPTSAALPAPPDIEKPTGCPVTQPNGRRPPDPERVFAGTAPGGYGNDALWTNVWMWGEGEVPVPTTHVTPSGAFGPMKWAWYQYGPGLLKIEGRRLDGPAPPLVTTVPGGYGGRGFHPTGLIFPTGGCWEVTGRVGEASLTFVTLVVPPATGDGVGGTFPKRGGETRNGVAQGRANT